MCELNCLDIKGTVQYAQLYMLFNKMTVAGKTEMEEIMLMSVMLGLSSPTLVGYYFH